VVCLINWQNDKGLGKHAHSDIEPWEIRDEVLAVIVNLNPKMYRPRHLYQRFPPRFQRPIDARQWLGQILVPRKQAPTKHLRARQTFVAIAHPWDFRPCETAVSPARFSSTQADAGFCSCSHRFYPQPVRYLRQALREQAGDRQEDQMSSWPLSMTMAPAPPPAANLPKRSGACGLRGVVQRKDGATPEVSLKYVCVWCSMLNELHLCRIKSGASHDYDNEDCLRLS